MLAFLPSTSDTIEHELASIPSLSTGLLSATQGSYATAQLLLDITQGARVSYSAYSPALPPTLSLRGDAITPWAEVLARARSAPQLLRPGLLATSVPGGGSYVASSGESHADATAAADRRGRLGTVSVGPASTLAARLAALRVHAPLLVADLPPGPTGYALLRTLSATRPAGELLLVVQRPPDRPGHELLWVAAGGLGGRRALTSASTNQHGLIAAIDLAPTILDHLGLPVPDPMRGEPLHTDGALDGSSLRALKARLPVIAGRRLPALTCLLGAWLLLVLAASLIPLGGDRRRRRAWAMRVGALGVLWAPAALLIPAALAPGRPAEFAMLVLSCLLLAVLSDRLLPWPRAPLAPALTAIVAICIDALAGTQLLMRSLLGPNPIFGARFYGIGNELKPALLVLALAAVAAFLYPSARSRRAAAAMALAGIALAAIEGSARIGAGVGGVILVSAGTALATVLLLPGALTRRRLLIVLACPAIGLLALAALDLATAHGSGHFTGSILHARSAGDLRDVIERRYKAAYDELRHGLMPLATALALLAGVVGVRRRERLLAPVAGDPAWLAALAGGLAAGLVGALTEDSGPVLLVVAVFTLTCVLGYLWGRPPVTALPTPRTPGRTRAGRSRALRPPGALSR